MWTFDEANLPPAQGALAYHGSVSTPQLPPGHHYAVTWGIPDNYAGMTNALLHRSRAFARLAGAEVTIVTYEFREDYDLIRRRLRERGHLAAEMPLINLWEDLRNWDDEALRRARATTVPAAAASFVPLGERGDHAHRLRNVLLTDDGKIDQIDYFRGDGTLLLSDRRLDSPWTKPRTLTLCDTNGEPIGTFGHVWDLYHFWLDSLPRDPIAWLIADSKTTANHLVGYQREDAVVIHVVHGSHLEPGTGRPLGELASSRKRSFVHLDAWDGVVFLTQQQLHDVDLLLGPGTNRHVIPNGRDVPDEPPTGDRKKPRGVMLTSLTKRKQVEHAVQALSKLRSSWRPSRAPHLDVWGRGPSKKSLSALIQKTKAPVTLRGYADNAVEKFQAASFSMLTSDNEAFGLVIVESMGRGCIPISYDMPYGPAEIITNEVDGFIVPANDIDALASTVRRVSRMSSTDLATMRAAAYARALTFSDEHVTTRWIEVMLKVGAAKQSALA